MPTSPARLAANRANALRSTGPRTPEGKSASSRNALKHGAHATDATLLAAPDSPAARLELLGDAIDALLALGERRALLDCLQEQYAMNLPSGQLRGQPD